MKKDGFLTDAQLFFELQKCEYCEEKPCMKACPADCSPADFIMAARVGEKSDFQRSAALIMSANPLGGVCGLVCPDSFCMKACVHASFTTAVNIPSVQATIIRKAKEYGMPAFRKPVANGKKIAVIGAGPAGMGAAAVLAQQGYRIDLYEQKRKTGGMTNLIPDFRLDKKVLKSDIQFFLSLGDITVIHKQITDPHQLVKKGPYDAVVVCSGLTRPIGLEVKGGQAAVSWQEFLEHKNFDLKNKKIAVVGGGAVAVDCAVTAKHRGALDVELIYRRKFENMPLTWYERNLLVHNNIEVSTCARVKEIKIRNKKVRGLIIEKLTLPPGKKPEPKNYIPDPNELPQLRPFDLVISAIGSSSMFPVKKAQGLFYAGDLVLGSSTVVESVASGKNAALAADAFLFRKKSPAIRNHAKGCAILTGRQLLPVSLATEFFGRKIISPFLISAAPHSDGYEQIKTAYEKGWAGAIMKTAFDNVPIHIPGSYMFVLGPTTYGNCDNVSGHALDRVCKEIARLVIEYPDRLTMASTGGPVTGHDDADRKVWQSNTRKLEDSGARAIEYSLSCPQGGDGAKGDVVSQDAELTAKIIDWIMQTGRGDIPKLFKLTAAVTSIRPIIEKILSVFNQYPDKKAGITLANSFPSLAFRKTTPRLWEEGIVVGMSGEGVLPISNYTLAKVAGMGIAVSGNGGPMNYKAAANFLALGAETVQFCTIVMKYGYGIINDLQSGLSYLMQERGFRSVKELVGSSLPNPITPFELLSAGKMIPQVDGTLCEHCGNCTRCPYQAISLDKKLIPTFDASCCVGCSLCAQKCFSGAITMRERTIAEHEAMQET